MRSPQTELARPEAAQLTRDAYTGGCRAFCRLLVPEALTETVRGSRDVLERHGRSPSTFSLASELRRRGDP